MDIELLRTFLELERSRHFGHTAEALHRTQAAVSARIKQLESMVGAELFDRSKRELRLTPAGARLIRYADLIISEWRKARQDVAAGGADRQISIGGSLRLWDPLLQGWLHRVRRRWPELAIIAESHSPEVLTRRILDGVLDVAFMLEPAQLEALQVEEIAIIRLALVSSRVDLTVDTALGDGYLMVDWGFAHALHHRRLFPDAPEPRLRVGQAKMALAHLQDLGGSAYLPIGMVHDDVLAGRLHFVEEAPRIDRTAYAVFPIRSNREALIRECLALFRDDPTVEQVLEIASA